MPISRAELSWFRPHTNYFVECGSADGQGIQAAIAANFESIYSVDINPDCVRRCKERFSKHRNVAVTHADCGEWLETILNYLQAPCAVFLDANGWAGEVESPYHASIAALKRHGRLDHIVIVDDMNHDKASHTKILDDLRRSLREGSELDIVKQLVSVNPDYYLYIEDSHSVDLEHTYPSWILIGSPVDLGLNRI